MNFHVQVLARAALIVGGAEELAIALGTSTPVLARYLRGEFAVPPRIFLKATEIITDHAVEDAANAHRKPEPETR